MSTPSPYRSTKKRASKKKEPEVQQAPVEVQPKAQVPVESQPVPAESKPEAQPAESKPEAHAAESKPEAHAAESKPEAHAAESKPEAHAAEPKPEAHAAPGESLPAGDPDDRSSSGRRRSSHKHRHHRASDAAELPRESTKRSHHRKQRSSRLPRDSAASEAAAAKSSSEAVAATSSSETKSPAAATSSSETAKAAAPAPLSLTDDSEQRGRSAASKEKKSFWRLSWSKRGSEQQQRPSDFSALPGVRQHYVIDVNSDNIAEQLNQMTADLKSSSSPRHAAALSASPSPAAASSSASPPPQAATSSSTSSSSSSSSSSKDRKKIKYNKKQCTAEPPSDIVKDEWGNPTTWDHLPKSVKEALWSADIYPDMIESSKERFAIAVNIARFLSLDKNKSLQYTVEPNRRPLMSPEEHEARLCSRDSVRDKYRLGELLGEGAFGRVHVGHLINPGGDAAAASSSTPAAAAAAATAVKQKVRDPNDVAIKIMPYETEYERSAALIEIELLRLAQHPSVVRLLGSYVVQTDGDTDVWLLMENMEGGTLNRAKRNFTEPHVAFVARELLLGIQYMHGKHILHRDLKSENIMLTTDGGVKLIDFGLSRLYDAASPPNEMVGSPFWMSPEMIAMKTHGPPTDIWSFAVSLLELINQAPPNRASNVRAMWTTATVGLPEPFNRPKKWSKLLHDFVTSALVLDPHARATADSLLDHPFLELACPKKEMRGVISALFLDDVLAQAGLGF